MTQGYTYEEIRIKFPEEMNDNSLYLNTCSFCCEHCDESIWFPGILKDISVRIECPHCKEDTDHVVVQMLKHKICQVPLCKSQRAT